MLHQSEMLTLFVFPYYFFFFCACVCVSLSLNPSDKITSYDLPAFKQDALLTNVVLQFLDYDQKTFRSYSENALGCNQACFAATNWEV